MDAIASKSLNFVMPARKTAIVKKAITAYHNKSGKQVIPYTMKNKENRKITVTLIITLDNKKAKEKNIIDKYHVFVTNISVRRAKAKQEYLIDAYKKRWGIETGYRQIEMIRPATRSADQSVRMILFFTALCMYNVWAITRSDSESKTGLEMKVVMYHILLTSLMRCELSSAL